MEKGPRQPGGLKSEEWTETSCSYDSVTVFQSAPLVYRSQDGKYHAMLSPNFDEEKRHLLDAVSEAETIGRQIDIFFEPANTDRLATFLASGRSPVLHFSSHGHPAYLLIEVDGRSEPLRVERLKGLIAASVSKPKLAFVSACHSQPAGDAFLAAGIEHVVCCRHDKQILDTAAIIFAQNFYKALAFDNAVLKEAFRIAHQSVLNSPLVADAEREADKFLLLPEKGENDDYHCVHIFYRSPSRPRTRLPSRRKQRNFPPPPALFLGRELDMFHALQALQRVRLVQVTGAVAGAKDFGRLSFAKAVCCYLHERCSIFDEFYWLSDGHIDDEGEVSSILRTLYARFRSKDLKDTSSDYSDRLNVIWRLAEIRALITVDVREWGRSEIANLESFLALLFDGTRHVKVMILCAYQFPFDSLQRYGCGCIVLPPLGFKMSVKLFGSVCRHVSAGRCLAVSSATQLSKLLVPRDEEDTTLEDESISKYSFEILKLIGCGIPGNTHAVASSMTEKEYDKLVWMAEQRTRDPISTIMRICPQTTLQEHISNLLGPATSPEPNQSQSVENGSSILLSGLSKGTGQLPAATPATDDEHTSSSDGSAGFVGVEFSGTNMDENLEWNDRIIASKQQIEQNLKKLLRYGNLGFGGTELKVEHLQREGMEKAVARLECEIELREDLKRQEYGRVRAICKKLADLLREAGATDADLEKLMIGCLWRGSLELLLEGPSSCLSLLATECFHAETKLLIGPCVAHLIDVAPAFLVQGPHRLFASRKQSSGEADILVWKRESTRLLCPTSSPGRKLLFEWGLGESFWELEHVVYAKDLTEGEYSFVKMTIQPRMTQPRGVTVTQQVEPEIVPDTTTTTPRVPEPGAVAIKGPSFRRKDEARLKDSDDTDELKVSAKTELKISAKKAASAATKQQLVSEDRDPAKKLAYAPRDETVMTRAQIRKERLRLGYCTECEGEPVRLFDISRSRYNPFWKRRTPLTEMGESFEGVCLVCHPERDPDRLVQSEASSSDLFARSEAEPVLDRVGLGDLRTMIKQDGDLGANVVRMETPFGKPIEEVYKGVHTGEVLGSGISGIARLVTHRSTGVEYAVKILDLGLIKNEEDLECVREEIFIMCQLDHPNIVRLQEVYESASEIYLVLELCRGGDLFDRLEEQPDYHYTEAQCARLVKQMLSALRYLHSKNIMHRDLSLEDFLFSTREPDSLLKMIDFGLSKHFQFGEVLHDAVGTPYTVAPEILLGSYGEKVDIWAIGVITFLLFTGETPFGGACGEDLRQVRENILNGVCKFEPEHLWENVSDLGKDFVKTLLSVDPKDRPLAKEAQRHPWIQTWAKKEKPEEKTLNPKVIDALISFKELSDMQKLLSEVLSFTLLPEQIEGLRHEFEKIDKDGDGEIMFSELKQVLMGSAGSGSLGALTDEEIEDIFQALRVSKDKNDLSIHWHEFIAAGLSQCKVDDRNLRLAFDRLDLDEKGYIILNDIISLMGSNGNNEKEAVTEMWLSCLRDIGSSHEQITFDDFLVLMKDGCERTHAQETSTRRRYY